MSNDQTEPVVGTFQEGESNRRLLIFMTEDDSLVATVEGEDFPVPEVGDRIGFGISEVDINIPEGKASDTSHTYGGSYRVECRSMSFTHHTVSQEVARFGPFRKSGTGHGLATIIECRVSELEE